MQQIVFLNQQLINQEIVFLSLDKPNALRDALGFFILNLNSAVGRGL